MYTFKKKAFTLGELLVSMAALGVIVALAIPKVLQVGNEAVKQTTYKTTIELVQKIVSNGMLNADFNELPNYDVATANDGLTAYFTRQINGTPCETGNTNEPCNMVWGAGSTPPAPVTGTSARWVLLSGARVWIPAAVQADGLLFFRIDAQLAGVSSNDGNIGLPDLLELTCNLNDASVPLLGRALRPGECRASDANNQLIYEAIYRR